MVGRPQALLFDEPLSNLDARLRIEMRNELRRIQRQIGLTSIYVTHDQAEALAISDWIVVMKDGRIVERGRPIDIYRYPRHVFTAQFLGTTNLIAGTVEDVDAGIAARRDDAARPHRRHRPEPHARSRRQGARQHPAGGSVDAGAAAAGAMPVNAFEGRLTFAVFAGVAVEAEVRCGESQPAVPAQPRGRPDAGKGDHAACQVLTPVWCLPEE